MTKRKKNEGYRPARTDSGMSAVEFVRPLTAEIQTEVIAPAVDLSSPEAAHQSLEDIQATMEQLEGYHKRVKQLQALLEQEKLDLNK